MGVANLLPFVKNACRPGKIKEFEKQTVAVDVSCFLHKGLFGCVEQVANGLNSKNYISYVKRRVQALLDLNCHVILVFDGASLPAKKTVNDQRRDSRTENLRIGSFLLSQGRKEEAVMKLQKAVSLTREVIEDTLEAFYNIPHVDVIVAPYEADAQLAFLLNNNLADVVITEDSDLIVFGCSKIVFKWDFDSDSCSIYDKSLLHTCFTGEMNKNFDFKKFRRICILSGCDYLLNGLPGVGLSKSYNFFTKTTQDQLEKILPRIPSYLKMPKLVVTTAFIEDFVKAEQTFLHQIVFDPREKRQRPLNDYENTNSESFPFAGSVSESAIAIRHSLGNLVQDPIESDKFKLPENIPSWSVWSEASKEYLGGVQRQNEKKAQKISIKKLSPKRAQETEKISLKKLSPKRVEKVEKRSTKKLSPTRVENTEKMSLEKLTPTRVEKVEKRSTKKLTPKRVEMTEEMFIEMSSPKRVEKAEKKPIEKSSPSRAEKTEVVSLKDLSPKLVDPPVKNLGQKNEAEKEKPLVDRTQEQVNTACRYFKRRNNSCSNPFKKPKIELGTVDIKTEQSVVFSCKEDNENVKPTSKIQTGFRFSGLRRKSSVP